MSFQAHVHGSATVFLIHSSHSEVHATHIYFWEEVFSFSCQWMPASASAATTA